MTFWGSNLDSNMRDPKRKFRFTVTIGGLGQESLVWYAKTVTKPTINIGADTAHKYLGHTFKFPGSVTWDDIELTLVDPAGDKDDAAEKLLKIYNELVKRAYKLNIRTDIDYYFKEKEWVDELGWNSKL